MFLGLLTKVPKFNHGLVISDLYVKDRQNFSSCLKIPSENVFNLLNQNKAAAGTHCYLSILNSVIIAYINRTTFYSIEMNAHCFTYILLLIINKVLPYETASLLKSILLSIRTFFIITNDRHG